MPAIAFPAPGGIVYRVGGPLPSLATRATVYRAGATTTSARVARLAEALGLTGPIRADASGWSVGGADHSLQVQRAGGLPWTLSSSGGGSVSSGCAVASPGSTSSSGISPSTPPANPSPTCPTTTTVPGLPAQADAERLARDVLTRAGVDLTGATASSTGGPDSWYVSFTPVIGGLPVLGGQSSVTIGANGSVLSGSGWLADPVNLGDYPLVGVAAGVHRLEEGGKWIVYRGPVPMAGGPLGASAAVTTTAVTTTAGTTTAVPPGAASAPISSPDSGPGGSPAVPPTTGRCQPGQPCPAGSTTTTIRVAPVVVTITGVHLAEAWAWPLDRSNPYAWLVPVYVFQLAGGPAYPFFGNTVPVLAVADQYVAAPPPTTLPTGVTKPGAAPGPNPAVTASPPNSASSKSGTIVGVLQAVGGPPPGTPRPVPGTITIGNRDGATYTASAGPDGTFEAQLPVGSYTTVTGRSPLYQGGTADCTVAPPAPITVTADGTTRITIDCEEK